MKQYLLNLLPRSLTTICFIDASIENRSKNDKFMILIWGNFVYHQMTLCTNFYHRMALTSSKRAIYVLANETLYVCIINRIWNKITSTFGECLHCGYQSEELGCIVHHKVFLICPASSQDTYKPRLTPQAVLHLTHAHTKRHVHTHLQNLGYATVCTHVPILHACK